MEAVVARRYEKSGRTTGMKTIVVKCLIQLATRMNWLTRFPLSVSTNVCIETTAKGTGLEEPAGKKDPV